MKVIMSPAMSPANRVRVKDTLHFEAMDDHPSKKAKTAVVPPSPPEGWDRCHAYMERKSRFCRQECLSSLAALGYRYCGNHIHLLPAEATAVASSSGQTNNNSSDSILAEKAVSSADDLIASAASQNKMQALQRQSRQRVPCPVDPTHWIPADKVQQHIAKCPKTTAHQKQTQELFYCQDCNTGGYDGSNHHQHSAHVVPPAREALHQSQPLQMSKEHDLAWAQRLALRVLQVHQHIFSTGLQPPMHDVNIDKGDAVAHVVPSWTRHDIYQAIPEMDLSHAELDAGLATTVERYRIKSGGERHLRQQASMIGHLRRVGVLDDAETALGKSSTNSAGGSDSSSMDVTETKKGAMHTADQNELSRRTKTNGMELGHVDDAQIQESNANVETCTTSSKPSPPLQNVVFLELGAGRGMTGLLVAGVAAAAAGLEACTDESSTASKATPTTRLILVERGASRSRAEKCLRKAQQIEDSYSDTNSTSTSAPPLVNRVGGSYPFRLSGILWNRIHCDLAHVNMQAVWAGNKDDSSIARTAPQGDVVVIAKHLCGVGTDLALKSLESIREKVTACIMTTCCHGVCNWKDYVGRDTLRDVMEQVAADESPVSLTALPSFGELEFELLRQWSSGTVKDKEDGTAATTQDVNDDDEKEHETSAVAATELTSTTVYSVAKMVESLKLQCGVQGLGRASQRLIDYGRLEYLRQVIFQDASSRSSPCHSELVHYVPETVTPQNAALIAYRK